MIASVVATLVLPCSSPPAQGQGYHHAPISPDISDHQIVDESQQRAREKREAAEAARQDELNQIERQLQDERDRERQEQLKRFAEEQRRREQMEKDWLEKRQRTEEEQKRWREEQQRNQREWEQQQLKQAEANFWRLANGENGVVSKLTKAVDALPDESSE